jgi:hypothetical protein
VKRGNRPHGKAVREDVIAEVREALEWAPLPDPERRPTEILPPDVADDPALTRRLLRSL